MFRCRDGGECNEGGSPTSGRRCRGGSMGAEKGSDVGEGAVGLTFEHVLVAVG